MVTPFAQSIGHRAGARYVPGPLAGSCDGNSIHAVARKLPPALALVASAAKGSRGTLAVHATSQSSNGAVDLEQLWDSHTASEFVDRDPEKALSTMVRKQEGCTSYKSAVIC